MYPLEYQPRLSKWRGMMMIDTLISVISSFKKGRCVSDPAKIDIFYPDRYSFSWDSWL